MFEMYSSMKTCQSKKRYFVKLEGRIWPFFKYFNRETIIVFEVQKNYFTFNK